MKKVQRGARKTAPVVKTTEAYPTIEHQLTTLVNTHHSHLVVGDREAALRALKGVHDLVLGNRALR